MTGIKDFILEEINKNIKKENWKKRIQKYRKDLVEAVNLQSELKKTGKHGQKLEVASKLVNVTEQRLLKEYHEFEEDCGCEEGEGQMLKSQLLSISEHAKKLYDMIEEDEQFEDWIQSKITLAEDYVITAYNYLMYNEDGIGDEAGFGEERYYMQGQVGEITEGSNHKEDGKSHDYDDALDPDIDDEELFSGEDLDEADKKWIQKAIKKPGQLHKDLEVPKGKKIPPSKLKAAAKKGGKVGQRARMAQTLRKLKK